MLKSKIILKSKLITDITKKNLEQPILKKQYCLITDIWSNR